MSGWVTAAFSIDSCLLPLFTLPLHHAVGPRLEVLTQSTKFHTYETSPFLEGIWATWFQASHLSFPLGSCVTYLGKSLFILQAERGFTLFQNYFLAQLEIMHPCSKCWLSSQAKFLECPNCDHQDTSSFLRNSWQVMILNQCALGE